VKEFDKAKQETHESVLHLFQRYAQLKTVLSEAQSRAAIEACQRAAIAAHKQLQECVETRWEAMIDSFAKEHAQLVEASERC
jgi:hypothetical protein